MHFGGSSYKGKALWHEMEQERPGSPALCLVIQRWFLRAQAGGFIPGELRSPHPCRCPLLASTGPGGSDSRFDTLHLWTLCDPHPPRSASWGRGGSHYQRWSPTTPSISNGGETSTPWGWPPFPPRPTPLGSPLQTLLCTNSFWHSFEEGPLEQWALNYREPLKLAELLLPSN